MQTIAKHGDCGLTMAEALAQTRPPLFPRAKAGGQHAASASGTPRKGGRHE